MCTATQRMLKEWDQLPSGAVLNVRRQTSALALDIVGGALFGADLAGDTEEMAKAVDAGQRLAALLPLPSVPARPRRTGWWARARS